MVNRSLTANVKEIVDQYGLRLYSVKAYDSLYKKSAAFCASTDKGKYLIKPFHQRAHGTKWSRNQQISRISSYFQKLKEGAFPHSPSWLTTSTGRFWVSQNGRPYYMTEWLEGRNLQIDNEEDYTILGRALANLHTVCKDSLPSMSPFTQKQIKHFQKKARLFRNNLPGIRNNRTMMGKWFLQNGDRCHQLAEEAWKIVDKSRVKRIIRREIRHPALIHGDVTTPNVIIHAKGLFLIDWDSLRMDSTYYEIAKTLLNTTAFNLSRMHAFLHGYEEIKPFKSAERLLISALFRLPREAWYAAQYAQDAKGKRVFLVLEQTWEDRMNAIRWMDEWARQSPPVAESTKDIPQ
jgi:Ser/Thr protein kinase RdoA (MazF antagonist)